MTSAAARIEGLLPRLNSLAQRSFGFWMRCGPDREHGGFYATLDRQGNKTTPTDKGLIQQVRHLWALSMWYALKEPAPEVQALADNLYAFVRRHFYNPSSREYFYKVSEAGLPVDRQHLLYAQAFAIYGLAEYARAFDVPAAAEQAFNLFEAIDARAHDSLHGGYRQVNDAPWLPAGADKETNTHLHLMEAYTTLYGVCKEPQVKQRLEELVRLITTKILRPPGYAHPAFKRDWTPVGAPAVSYGHDLETYWLLGEAARALVRPCDPQILEPAHTLGSNSAEWGFDPLQGGYFEAGPPGGQPGKLEKVWWVQAEALPGLFRLYEQTGNERYLERLAATLSYVEQRLCNPATGEWFWGVLPDGSVGPRGDAMGEEWKASYHVLRGLVFTERWMQAWLKR